MKRLIAVVKNKIDWVMIILGSCLIIYNLFSFESTCGGVFHRRFESCNAYVYYYSEAIRFNMAVGLGLIIWGVLLYKNKRNR